MVPDNCQSPDELIKTLVFVDDRLMTQTLCKYIRKLLPRHMKNQVGYYNSNQLQQGKNKFFKAFCEGKIKFLLTTEAIGMVSIFACQNDELLTQLQGADIPDVGRVIQFGVLSSLLVWMQRAGRAGRSPGIQAEAILFVKESVFKKRKMKRKKDNHLRERKLL